MKIVREFLGQKIEIKLTDAELLDAYQEKRTEYGAESLLDDLESEGYKADEIPSSMVYAMAREVQDVAYKMDLPDGLEDARQEVMNRHRGMLKYYKEGE